SYLVLIASFILNSGISGPTLLMFFLSFQVLIAFSKRKLRHFWIGLHILTGIALMITEYYHPSIIFNNYTVRADRFIDYGSNYIVCLLFMYIITLFLRDNYNRERKLAIQRQVELQSSEAKLRAFFESSPACHLLAGTEGEVLDHNGAASRFIYATYKKEIQKGNPVADYLSDAYKVQFTTHYKAALEGFSYEEDVQANYSSGVIWWHVSYIPARDMEGKIIGVTFNASDITERKLHEEKIKQKNEALSKIAFIQSHEFRAPVANIMQVMDLIKMENYQATREYLDLLEKSVDQLDQKIRKVVDLTQDLKV
ncbi:MAG: putative sensor protein, partial [Chitinophagaceae bacterium]|nr:putative sensor protein [Chitinophagaceae bacterium]